MSLVALGAGAALWPFIDSMNPAQGTKEADQSYVDLTGLREGQQLEISWRGRPVLILHRTPAQLAELHEPLSRNFWTHSAHRGHWPRVPTYAQNWHRSLDPQIMVLYLICLWEGCAMWPPSLNAESHPDTDGSVVAKLAAIHCPCCGSAFDRSGRSVYGPSADLSIPPYQLLPDRTGLILGGDVLEPRNPYWSQSRDGVASR